MTSFRSEVKIPIRLESSDNSEPGREFIQPSSSSSKISDRGYGTLDSRRGHVVTDSQLHSRDNNCTFSSKLRDTSADDIFNRFDKSLSLNMFKESDKWYEDTRRRFDERRRQWDERFSHMRDNYFASFPRSNTSNTLQGPISSPSEQNFTTHFEQGEDGEVHFLARFEVHDFEPDDLRVSIRNGQVTVSAYVEKYQSSNTITKRFTRSVDLPKGCKEELITAIFNADGTLLIDCPLQPPHIPYISNVKRSLASSSNKLHTSDYSFSDNLRAENLNRRFTNQSRIVEPVKCKSYNIIRSQFHVEIPIGMDYSPEEIQISTLNQRVHVKARHDEKTSNRNTFREFSKEYDIPTNVDPLSITARLEKGILHLDGKRFE